MTSFPQVQRNEVRTIACSTWNDFIVQVRGERPMSTGPTSGVVADLVIFRGHWDPSWKLSSRLERNFVMYGRREDGQVQVFWAPQTRSLEWYDRYCAAILLRFRNLSTTLSGYSPTLSNDE